MLDTIFTNGVIAVREKQLLGDKILRFSELSAEEALRALKESGFGGAEGDGEDMCRAEEAALDSFVREYAPSKAELIYLLAPRDFHNAKALCKSEKLKTDAGKLLAPEGIIKVSDIASAIQNGEYGKLGALAGPVKEVMEREDISGAEVGAIFDRALYSYLFANCGRRGVLKKLITIKVDCTNILTAMRSGTQSHAEKLYLDGGKLKREELAEIFGDKAEKALEDSPYRDFYRVCLEAKEKGQPFTAAEKLLDSCEAEYFVKKKFELEGKQPFLYYVFRRRAEISNVRIVLVCLGAGLDAREIRGRLRAV